MCEDCLDCFFRCEEGKSEFCFFDPENPVEINWNDRACRNFELCEEAEAERRKEPGEL